MFLLSWVSKLFSKDKQVKCNSWVFTLVAALFFTMAFNLAFFCKAYSVLKMNSITDYVLFASFFVVIFCANAILFTIILLGFLRKPLLILLLFCSAAGSYFSLFYGIYINADMITNTLQTNVGEASGLITYKFLVWMLLLAVVPSVFVVFAVQVKTQVAISHCIIWRVIMISVCLLTVLAIYLLMSSHYVFFMRNNKQIHKLISPSNYISGLISYGRDKYRASLPFVNIGMDAKRMPVEAGQKKKLLIVVVGETSRAKNFSLNGYERNTNPLLSKQTNLFNFEHVSSCGTATAVSVPCLFSNMERKKYQASLAARQDNVLDILARTGINVYWRENDGGCKGVCKRIPTDELKDFELKQSCPQGLCYDINLLTNLEDYIQQRTDDTVIVLHTNGSHGPTYYQRYQKAQEHFTPACDTNEVDRCSNEQLINVYDNTIVNVDYVLNSTIELLKRHSDKFSTAMLYVSDHGESLGENGFYLHAAPYSIAPKEQTHVPMILWLSETFLQQQKIDRNCLLQKGKTDTSISHDNVFHTLLGAMQVATEEYKLELDIFSSCQSS